MSELSELSPPEDIDVPVVPKAPNQFSDLIPCPECGQQCHGTTGLGVHRSVQHGVSPKKPSYKKPKKPKTPSRPKPKPTQLPSNAAEYEDTPDWTADDIFTSVVGMMFPSGSIPTRALPSLVEWHHATERMLRGI